jgi:metal-responsive CopG/Arc/MetJ family transcriptional regulator
MKSKKSAAIETPRVSVLLTEQEAARFDTYCRERGFKKSSLIARLIREHLDHQNYAQAKVKSARRARG